MALEFDDNAVDVNKKIEVMAKRLVEKFDPDKIILFGSHARGTGRG